MPESQAVTYEPGKFVGSCWIVGMNASCSIEIVAALGSKALPEASGIASSQHALAVTPPLLIIALVVLASRRSAELHRAAAPCHLARC